MVYPVCSMCCRGTCLPSEPTHDDRQTVELSRLKQDVSAGVVSLAGLATGGAGQTGSTCYCCCTAHMVSFGDDGVTVASAPLAESVPQRTVFHRA